MNMQKIFTLFIISLLSTSAFAQFGGGPGGGGGGSRGGGSGRGDFGAPRERQSAIPGTAEANTPKGNGKIKGIVVDSTSKKPVEFAALSLIDTKTNQPIDGTTTDEKGQFSMTKVANGDFKILISFIGYKNKTIANVKIDRKTDIDLGNVILTPDVVQLNEVEVVGMAQLVEEKVDRLVYNAEKDITSKGGDASDIMKKVPMLTVDLDGNVSLRGSSNVRVLINNKPSTIIATSVADALKQIPADMIKSVEVITSPSARYDAEGSAGIINIITKKSTLQGGTIDLNTSVGNRGSNLGLRGNYRTGKMGFSLGGFGRFNYNQPGESENLQTGKQEDFSIAQYSKTKNKGAFGSYNLGWDYDLNSSSSLSANIRYGLRNMKNIQELTTINRQGSTTNGGYRDVDVKDLSGTWDMNVDYLKTLGKTGQELSVSGQYSRNNRTNDFDADIFALSNQQIGEKLGEQGNANKSYNQESTIQIDYQTPLGKTQMLEVGGKGIFRQVVSNYDYYNTITTPQPSSNLNYDQNVAAGYLSYSLTTKSRFSLKAGARYEYTSIDATQGEAGNLNLPSYANLVPSINISQTFGKAQTIKLAYNRRLQRPGIQFLNPNINASNPTNITVGNPELNPELTDQVEMSTSFFKNSLYINVSTFARFTNNSIESIKTTSPEGVITTTYGNIGSKKNYGANLFGNITFFKRWQLGGGFDMYYADLSNNSPNPALTSHNTGFVLSGRFRTSLTIKNGWGLQAGGFMRGKDVQLQGSQAGFRMYDFGIKKDFANKRGSVGIGMENFLSATFTQKNSFETSTFTQNSVNHLYNRGFRVNFSYRLGKMNFVEQKTRRKKSISNDDQKGDSGGGDMGGGAQTTGGATGGGGAPAAGGQGAGQRAGQRPQIQGTPVKTDSTAAPVKQPGQFKPDSTARPDSLKRGDMVKPDSTIIKKDSTVVKPDTIVKPDTTAKPDTIAKPALPTVPADTTKKEN